jgi:hypothetical protein
MPETPQLPICCHRGEILDIAGSANIECYQIHVRGREQVGIVSPQICVNCGYHDELFSAAPRRYQQPTYSQPTKAEYLAHWQQCRGCEFRQGNFCTHAAGSCGLAQKLGKADFKCPHGKFESPGRL